MRPRCTETLKKIPLEIKEEVVLSICRKSVPQTCRRKEGCLETWCPSKTVGFTKESQGLRRVGQEGVLVQRCALPLIAASAHCELSNVNLLQ